MKPALPSPLDGWMEPSPRPQSLLSIRPTRLPPFTWPQQSWRLKRGDHGFAVSSSPTAVASCLKAAVLRSWTAVRSSAPSVSPAVAGPSRTFSAARPPSPYWRAPATEPFKLKLFSALHPFIEKIEYHCPADREAPTPPSLQLKRFSLGVGNTES